MKNLPFWFPKKSNVLWYILFVYLFILSLDFWGWYNYQPLIFGLPFWVIYFFILTIITAFIFYMFSKYYWADAND